MIRARQCVGLLALPDEVLGIVLAYGDLGARFTCVAASSPLRDAQDRLSPAHEHKLLVRDFPILKPLLDANKTLAPAALYRRQVKLFDEDSATEQPPTLNLDAYAFYLELELILEGNANETIYVGTGTLGAFSDSDPAATVSFPIPDDIWSRANETHGVISASRAAATGPRTIDIKISVMASRTRGGSVECVRVCQGYIQDNDDGNYFFGSCAIPVATRLERAFSSALHLDMQPGCYTIWYGPSPGAQKNRLAVCLNWRGGDEMTIDEAHHMLEFVNWA